MQATAGEHIPMVKGRFEDTLSSCWLDHIWGASPRHHWSRRERNRAITQTNNISALPTVQHYPSGKPHPKH